jgi:hypothetical protein
MHRLVLIVRVCGEGELWIAWAAMSWMAVGSGGYIARGTKYQPSSQKGVMFETFG